MELSNSRNRALFKGVTKPKTRIEIPESYSVMSRWIPKIGDFFPNFWTESTQGDISFHAWAAGKWTVLFSHPCAYTPVCSTEIAEFASLRDDFKARGVNLLGLTHSTRERETAWLQEIEENFSVRVDFPIISDPLDTLSTTCGIYATDQAPEFRIRKTFIIDPSLRIRMLFEYPPVIGRSTTELLRVIDALQMSDSQRVALPCDWSKGQHCLSLPEMDGPRGDHPSGDIWANMTDYARVTDGMNAAY